MTEPKVMAGFYPLYEKGIETGTGNIFNSMFTNDNFFVRKPLLKKEGKGIDDYSDANVKAQKDKSANIQLRTKQNQSGFKVPLNAVKGAINYPQTPN